ncbi:MAG TPA: SMP-30/gluconolactonase/LRE family protein, partial [Tepidisphaeraceae bacterium]|nr:SMP-30/gluconolactonase/LRE family protein [Tepidisphaeraceae bacterium]
MEIVVDGGDRCGEGPIWDFRARKLSWTDIPRDVVYELSEGERRAVHRGTNVSTIALGREGGLFFGGAGGLWRWSEKKGCELIVA